jgi:hypothetical protein
MSGGLQLERALFRIYDGLLHPFALDASPLCSRDARGCTPRRTCAALQLCTAALAVFLTAAVAALHADHVGSAGCFGAVAAQAAAQWARDLNASGAGNATAGFAFREDDVFEITVDWSAAARPSIAFAGSAWPTGAATGRSQQQPPDYVFSATDSLVNLDFIPPATSLPFSAPRADSSSNPQMSPFVGGGPSMARARGVRVLNMTIPATGCAPAPAHGSFDFLLALTIVSYDTVMVNSLMWTFPASAGYVVNTLTGESWSWGPGGVMAMVTSQAAATAAGKPLLNAAFLAWRMSAVVQVVVGFFFFASLAALLVRTLLTSGAALLYPFAACARCCIGGGGAAAAAVARDAERQLNAAYPWVGAHVHQARLLGRRSGPTIAAHVQALVFVVVLQAAAQSALSAVFFQWKSFPADLPLVLWCAFLVGDYFALVCARSRGTLVLYPRCVFLAYLCFGCYYYAVPYGFFAEASTLFLLAIVNLMLTSIVVYEVPALRAGKVSIERPRERMARTLALEPDGDGSSGVLSGSVPQLWSMFSPLNYEPRTLWDAVAPEHGPQPPNAAGEGAAPENVVINAAAVAGATNAPSEAAAGGSGEQPLLRDTALQGHQ